ncbi:AcrR family transcriptional regulator [Actinoplanes lutulentus]|uniref:TetR family transcriptional regulator n=1 Tax=Actinoplanes lutulentus TaxID=1287878 RepID=A0A327ZDT4_9ACTN|nr:TetR/AcrR family transcriptional regulator [Actinoplanes lutulentus]MBB2942498.1 AcrR family transcriptional regulator [Actinoplanes lutulentus]RAK38079.1 TetR family transcriptional regulator [Actinoplanes lutulentus]
MLDFHSRSANRKTPQQQRSREMIDRILAATAQVLAERGYAGLSTNRVAAQAGVSVGSLYRYFADKNELIEELRSRSSADVLADLTGALTAAVPMPARDGVRHVLTVLVAALKRHRAVTIAMIDEAPLGAHGNILPEVERQLAQITRIFVAVHAPHLEQAEADARIHLAMGVTLNACLRIALDPAPGVSEDRMIDLTAELLVLGLAPLQQTA